MPINIMFDTISQQLYVGYTDIGSQPSSKPHLCWKNSKPLPRTVLSERRFPQLAMGCDLNLFWILKWRNGDVLEISIANFIWRFPEMGLPPNHQFLSDFHYKPSIWGYHHLWKPPYGEYRLTWQFIRHCRFLHPSYKWTNPTYPTKKGKHGYNLHSGMSHHCI